jgi:NAD+ kinase
MKSLPKVVGIIYHPKIVNAASLAEDLSQISSRMGVTAWLLSLDTLREAGSVPKSENTDLVLAIGGDGTILRVARAMTPEEIPIVGVNLGRLGFMAEFTAEEVIAQFPAILNGEGWLDRRMMLQAEVFPKSSDDGPIEVAHALNDAVVVRGDVPRVLSVETAIDGQFFTTYKCDGVIVATATGSTAYSLAVGGPLLYSQAEEILLEPIAPHFSLNYSLLLPPTAVITMEVHSEYQAMLSIDGQLNFQLSDGDKVLVKRSPYRTFFLRIHPPEFFYQKLSWR